MSVERLPSTPPFVRSLRWVGRFGRRLSFWSAVALPFVSLGLLLAGLETTSETVAFVVLVALNVVALVGGHRHARE